MISLSLLALAASLSGAALYGIVSRADRGHWFLAFVAWIGAIVYGAALLHPASWTAETAVWHGCSSAVLVVLYAAQRVRFGWLALALVSAVGAVGLVAAQLPTDMRWGYRGLAFAQLAACMPLLGNLFDPHPLGRVASRRLALWLAAEACAAAAWELSVQAGYIVERLAVLVYLWAFFGIAVQAFSVPKPARRPRPPNPAHA